MLNLKPEIVAQLERVLSSVEMLLPKAVAPIDWSTCHAANWRRHSFSGYLEPVRVTDTVQLNELLGVEEQKDIIVTFPESVYIVSTSRAEREGRPFICKSFTVTSFLSHDESKAVPAATRTAVMILYILQECTAVTPF